MRMKKKRHGDERLMLLSSFIITDPKEVGKKCVELFSSDAELRVEIGCGKGDFICAKSKAEPGYNYLAIEKMSDVIVVAAEKYANDRNIGRLAPNGGFERPDGKIYEYGSVIDDLTKEEMGNVRFVVGDAKVALESFDDSSVESIYINFCDPWSKKGYMKRRLTYIDFLKLYSRILKPGGKIYFKTDNYDLFVFTEEQIAGSVFEIEFKTNDLHASDMNESNIMTEYEKNFSSQGIKINMMIAKNVKKA